MKPTIKLTLFLFYALNFGILSAQSGTRDEIRKADSLISNYSDPNAPGMAVGIIRDGKIIYKKTYGLANLEDKIPVTDSTAFDIASVSKQFTAFIMLLAEREGRLSLEDDIRTYLPELKNLPYKITVRQLANHTHGLPDFTSIKRLQGFGDEFRVTNDQAIKTVLTIKSINFKPGERYAYNNTGFMLLAEILHRVYKKEFRELLKEYIFQPLNMNSSTAVDDPLKITPNRAESYQESNATFFKYPLGQMENGSSNIFTTLNDLCIWALNYQKPVIGSREIYNKMQQNTFLNSGNRVEYGLGLQTGKYKGLNVVFHGGGTAGYRSYILHIPTYRLSVVLAGNKGNFDGLFIAYKLVDLFLGNHQVLSAQPQKMSYTSAELKRFEGMYEINPGNYLEISSDGKNLYQGKSKMLLTIMGDDQFGIPAIPTASVIFHKETLTFNVGDFAFVCKKVKLEPIKVNKADLNKLTGFYRNEEFNTIYQLLVEGNTLIARHYINPDVLLYPLSPTNFYSHKSFLGQLDFRKDKKGNVTGFILAGANIANVEFKKIK
ncbi:serine hydrolase domain-containing protein [Chryseobacterium arthrosphaerae]|uniref:serine hydrolase domain-containing protein n=1 Tax=Chryseobacterium arthrosphaerae TaxID=651561 RepID=UPI001E33F5C7|nr:serine hydrolase domain-containing protein [Chryseobacterium arthrosphaerae]UEQ76985.1 beta-lactamase family protein [Chryseobacterium arthrosphaerae]